VGGKKGRKSIEEVDAAFVSLFKALDVGEVFNHVLTFSQVTLDIDDVELQPSTVAVLLPSTRLVTYVTSQWLH
jgi:hypothetical protein